MHAYSNTDLRKFDLCKFFSVFLVFQCGAFGRSLLVSGWVGFSRSDGTCLESGTSWSLVVRTIRVVRPDRRWLHRLDSFFISSGRARPVCSFPRQRMSGRHHSTVWTGNPQQLYIAQIAAFSPPYPTQSLFFWLL
jgi:hypothetical protein